MSKKVKDKKQNISINTGEPIIEEKDLDLNPMAILSDDNIGDKDEEDDDLGIDDDELDPYADKWEQ